MLKLTHRWADELMNYAEQQGTGMIYRQALTLAANNFDLENAPEEILQFLNLIPGSRDNKRVVLYLFLDMVRERAGLLKTEVISAVPLTQDQLEELDRKLSVIFGKQLEITASVDPSLLGGLRVVAGDTVLDDTIKRKLSDMKAKIYDAF